ncbi:leucine-rich repeat domain-containing protein [Paraliomyxa miuraensis]|uniref:leucine-rich repeat domain-containing protein n=1 Tax=Paraliomyxa miuraensis TaxID=376150 RepID=UPI002255B25B|nr:leucine-rich repeat domain-containing protein [Paraliomyxa miuraensis]MCX4241588.1 hypothetical protein [Paraliomyxa miuraensis]
MGGVTRSMGTAVLCLGLGACGPATSGDGSTGGTEATDGTGGSTGQTMGSGTVDATQGPVDGSSSDTHEPPVACTYQPGSCDPICLEDPVLDAWVREFLGLGPADVITPELAASLPFVLDDAETDVGSLGGLECFPNLETIVFRVDSFTDLTPIAGLEALEDLIIEDVPVAQLPPLAASQPTQIWLNRTEVEDVSSLAGSFLRQLHVEGSPVSDLAVVTSMPLLWELVANDTLVTDLSPIASAPELSHVELDGCGITELSPLFANGTIHTLALRRNQITDIAPLGTTQVAWLWIDDNPLGDLSPLASLAPLSYLTISDTQVTDLAPLVALPIESIELDRAPLLDPQQLWALPGLRTVSAAGIGLTSLDGMSLAIEWLHVPDNGLTDVSPIVDLTLLEELDLSSNEIMDLGAIENAPIFDVSCGRLWVTDNPLDAYSTKTMIPALCAGSVIVESDVLSCDQLDDCGPID